MFVVFGTTSFVEDKWNPEGSESVCNKKMYSFGID